VSLSLSALDGRVELREELGRGGMGEVHAAWDRFLQRPVAVKLLHRSGPAEAERLLLEARLQARVEHPHVVRVFEVGTLQGRPCVLFQLVPGSTLGELVPSLSVTDKVELVRQAAQGLHAAHLQGLVHRDVKPGNVLVEEAEAGGRTALVADFGLAHAEEGGLTRSGLLPGTLDFMSPEQLAGGAPVDFRSDVYALGATLYAVLAGRPPFRIPSTRPEQSGEEQVRLLRRILEEEAPPLKAVAPEVPRELSLVCLKAMEKEPGARYPSAEAFADDLSRFQRGEPLRARPATLGERALKWTRRNPATARALALALAVLLLAGGFTLWLSRQAGREALEAARLGALAASLESRMRMEYLSPPHDLRPALAEVRREAEGLRALAAGRGGGPASFALGKGLELTGDLDAARLAFQRAWDLGFRTPQVAEGLGTTLARIYQRERRQAEDTLDGDTARQRVQALRSALLEPARHLVDGAGGSDALVPAGVALVDGDFAAARDHAARALRADPRRYEALVLQGEAWLEEGKRLGADAKLDAAEAALARALPLLEEALRWGRSDPRLLRLLAEVHVARAGFLNQRNRDPASDLEAARTWAGRAAEMDPEDSAALVLRGRALVQEATRRFMTGARDPLVLFGEAEAVLQQAAERDRGPARAGYWLANCLYGRARYLFNQGQDGEPALAAAREVAESASRAAPADPTLRQLLVITWFEQGATRVQAGKDPGEALRRAVELGTLLVGMEGGNTPGARMVLGQALVFLGRQQSQAGGRAQPEVGRGLAYLESALRDAPDSVPVVTNVLYAMGTAITTLAQREEEDVRPLIRRARAVAEEALRSHPHLHTLRAQMINVLQYEIEQRVRAGEDPLATIAELDRLVGDGAAYPNPGEARRAVAYMAVQGAAWQQKHGLDPGASLRKAARIFEDLARKDPADAWAAGGLAACAEQEAHWERRNGRSPREAARRGLAHAARTLALMPQNVDFWILQALFQAMSGDLAAARRSQARALAFGAWVRELSDAKALEAELARAGEPGRQRPGARRGEPAPPG